jgi:hypothetical protein
LKNARHAEVSERGAAAGGDKDVSGFDVAVHDAGGVERVEAAEQVPR